MPALRCPAPVEDRPSRPRTRRSPRPSPRARYVLAALLFAAPAVPAAAIVCSVPGSHDSIRQAIADVACTQIQLANQVYSESLVLARTIDLVGTTSGSSTIRGAIAVSGAVAVGLTDLLVTGCADARVTAGAGASVSGTGLEVVTPASPACPWIFGDGFESSDTTAWSMSAP